MKPTRPGSRRQKIILYFTLAVVLPGIVLGYLAYRGIRNDQALREKENLRKLEISSQNFFTEIDSIFVQFMNEQTVDSILYSSGQSDPSVLALFVTDTNGSKKLITHKLLYLPDELLPVQPEQQSLQSNLKEGLRLEFIGHRFPEALRYYQNKVLDTNNPTEKIQSLVASARLYNKLNQPENAKALYNEIWKEYPGNLLNGHIPLGLMASLEILKINQSMGENDEIKKNYRRCLELLLHPVCEYDADQFYMFYQSFKEIIPESDRVIESLIGELESQRIRTDYLIQILTGRELDFTSGKAHIIDNKKGITSNPINFDELSAVCLTWGNNNNLQTGIVIDFPVYLESVSENLINKLDPGSSINVKIEDENGKLVFSKILKEEAAYLSFPFPEHLPKWKLLLSENKPGLMAALFKTGSGIYLFIFILIALFMILGFAFTMYTLNIELRLNKLKSEFISNVSHELKSPLTAIRMMTEMLHHNRVQTEERRSSYYSAMLEESEHLSHLIDNILDFSRIDDDRKKYEFTSLNLDELLMKFLGSTRARIKDQDFNIRYDRPDKVPLIKGDRDALVQVLYNLIDNAIKFSGKSKHIDVSLVLKDNELHLSVKDFGIGISPADREKVFERFYRCREPQEAGIRGSGIGLAIVKRIVEDHGGYLTLESSPGKGSNFTVRLPVR